MQKKVTLRMASNTSRLAEKGIVIAPTRKSAQAKLDDRTYECLYRSFLTLTAVMTSEFRKEIERQANDLTPTKIQGKVVSSRSNVKSGDLEQANRGVSSLTSVVEMIHVVVSFKSMLNAVTLPEEQITC